MNAKLCPNNVLAYEAAKVAPRVPKGALWKKKHPPGTQDLCLALIFHPLPPFLGTQKTVSKSEAATLTNAASTVLSSWLC